MQTKLLKTIVMGFLLGLGLVSCASEEADRDIASVGNHHAKCAPGENRAIDGDCAGPAEFDHPYHRAGR